MAGNTSQPGATVVSRTVALLTAFDESHPRLTLTALARRAGIPLATTHRLVGELTRLGVLARLSSGEYVVGRALWRVGLLAPMQTGLREVAAPFLQDLYAGTWPPSTWPSATVPGSCTWSACPASDRSPW